ncbi:hypothetical protein EOM09_08305 [bacterium]|nr:hypothetical protein [bacterium]
MVYEKKPSGERFKSKTISIHPKKLDAYNEFLKEAGLTFSQLHNSAIPRYIELYITQEQEQDPEKFKNVNIRDLYL